MYEAYRRSPEVTRRRLYLETMQRVLPQLGTKVFMDKGTGTVIPILPGDALRNLLDPKSGGGQ